MILAHTLTGRLPLNEFEDLMGLNNPEKRAYKHLDPETSDKVKKGLSG
ncbi:hypothetical protein [Methanobacterium sp.]|nr:hypothetical protein [Methanobacterium sp.]MDY9924305.1 hypothetical protein [Methanobacterium sp.]